MGNCCTVEQTLWDLEEMETPDLDLWNRWVNYVIKTYPRVLDPKIEQNEYLYIDLHHPLPYQTIHQTPDCVGYDGLLLVKTLGGESRYLFLNVYQKDGVIERIPEHRYQNEYPPQGTKVVIFTNQELSSSCQNQFPTFLTVVKKNLLPILSLPAKTWMPRKTIATNWLYL